VKVGFTVSEREERAGGVFESPKWSL
jgi:hypothetical protein